MCKKCSSVKTYQEPSAPENAERSGCVSGVSAPLVYNTNNSATFKPKSSYSRRNAIARVLFARFNHEKITPDGEVLTVPDFKVCKCQSALMHDVDLVKYSQIDDPNKRGHRFNKVLSCGSVWTCPICSQRISNFRAAEVNRAHELLSETHDAFMVTFTLSHKLRDPLKDTLNVVIGSFNYVNSHRSFAKNSLYNEKLYNRSTEIMFGTRNGWHPHLHVLYYFPKEHKVKTEPLKELLHKLTNDFYKKHGYDSSFMRGVTVKRSFSASEYISKFGNESSWRSGQELALSNHKKGDHSYHPFELPEILPDRFAEFAQATFGARQLTCSLNFRKHVPDFLKRTDEDISEMGEPDFINKVVHTFTKRDFMWLRSNNHLDEVIDLANSSNGDYSQLRAFLTSVVPPPE